MRKRPALTNTQISNDNLKIDSVESRRNSSSFDEEYQSLNSAGALPPAIPTCHATRQQTSYGNACDLQNPPQQPTVSVLSHIHELDLLLASMWSHHRDLEFCFPSSIGLNQSPGISCISSLLGGFAFCDIAVVPNPSSHSKYLKQGPEALDVYPQCYWHGCIAVDELRGGMSHSDRTAQRDFATGAADPPPINVGDEHTAAEQNETAGRPLAARKVSIFPANATRRLRALDGFGGNNVRLIRNACRSKPNCQRDQQLHIA